jgi:TonB family protein
MRPLILVALLTLSAGPATLLGQTDSTVYLPGDGVTLPSVVKLVNPDYTSEAKRQRIEGVVGLSCVVRPDGRVTDISVTQSLDAVFGLDKNAVEAMGQSEFKPGMKNNKPVAVKIAVQMNFTLK